MVVTMQESVKLNLQEMAPTNESQTVASYKNQKPYATNFIKEAAKNLTK